MSLQQKQKLINLLTICMKAGKTVRGFDSVCTAMKEKQVYCVLTAADISPKSLKETAFMCRKYDTALMETPLEKEDIERISGKQTAVIGICDKGFADGFMKLGRSADESGNPT